MGSRSYSFKGGETDVVRQSANILYVNDLRRLFRCGESKARLMMDVLPTMKIGAKDAVLAQDLNSYIAEHGGIKVKWPKRRR